VGKSDPIRAHLGCLRDVKRWLKAARADGVVIGGIAAGLLGTPRVTKDVDILVVIDDSDWSRFVDCGRQFGFESRISDAVAFARENRVLLMRHRPSKVDVDVSLGALDFEREVLERAISVVVQRTSIPVPTPEDLIIMKMIARRPRDIRDVEGLMERYQKLDLARVRRVVEDFASILESPEIIEDMERLLRPRPPKR